MKLTTKIFNILLLSSIAILTSMSLLALVLIHLNLADNSKYYLSLTPNGINNYLFAFGEYKALFTGTVATIAAYFGILRLKISSEANLDKNKQDRFSEWKTVLEIRIIEIEENNPLVKGEFFKIRYNLFQQLYYLNFNINNKQQLTKVIDSLFKELIPFFENQNKVNIEFGAIYPDKNYSYFFDSFQFIFLGCIDNYYSEIMTDLKELYIAKLPRDRIIDNDAFVASMKSIFPYLR